MAKIIVEKTAVTILNVEEKDYISLTDMANAKQGITSLLIILVSVFLMIQYPESGRMNLIAGGLLPIGFIEVCI